MLGEKNNKIKPYRNTFAPRGKNRPKATHLWLRLGEICNKLTTNVQFSNNKILIIKHFAHLQN